MGESPEAWYGYVEGIEKTVAALSVAAPDARHVVLSGRHARRVHAELAGRASMGGRTVGLLSGFASTAKEGAQGAALLADGLAGGRSVELVDTLGIRDASGTLLDYLHVISPSDARRRIGLR